MSTFNSSNSAFGPATIRDSCFRPVGSIDARGNILGSGFKHVGHVDERGNLRDSSFKPVGFLIGNNIYSQGKPVGSITKF